MNKKPSLRIVWAIDPTDQSFRFYRNVTRVLQHLQRGLETVIEPVHILRIAPDISAEFSARWAPELSSHAEAAIQGLIHKLNIPNAQPPRILFHNSLSTRGAVEALSNDARRSGADLIIAQSHGRKGLTRLFLGSFAETLLFHSPVPLMLIGPETLSPHSFRHILFPTDFSGQVFSQLDHVLDLARAFHSRVTLFHSVQHPIEPTGTGFYTTGPYGPFIEYIQKQISFANHQAEAAVDRARRQGIDLDYLIDPKGSNIWESILKLARKKKTGLIAMNAQSGPFSSALLGSTTRQVARRSSCPVWVLR